MKRIQAASCKWEVFTLMFGFRGKINLHRLAGSHTGSEGTTYLLTPWSRVLLEKLNFFAASKEILRIFM
jgi:hypothetical protein